MRARWHWSGDGVLFDMDGTLVDSGASVLRAWRWAAAELDLPFSEFAPYVHGIPAAEVLATVLPGVPARRRDELARSMLARQSADTADVRAVPGALAALAGLPAERWAVVTSADRPLALARLAAAGLPLPRVLITSELTAAGKPAPEPYLAGAAGLGLSARRCLVVEDSPAGVASGLAAGAPVLGVLGSARSLAGVSCQVGDLTEARFGADQAGVRVSARSAG